MRRHVFPQNRLTSEINVTPMADIMLVLLIIFMLATPILQQEVSVNLPKAKYPLQASNGPLILALNREGRIYLGRKSVTEQEMIQAVHERMKDELNRTMFLKADQTLAYGKVVHVVDQCRRHGVERIGLMAEKEMPATH
jgi:biopolymer transport protein TolR